MDMLLFPFQLPFMQTAFLIAALIAPAAALLSCFLVLKGWSLMGDAVSHAVLPGIVLAYVAGIPVLIGAFVAGLLCSVGVGYIRDNSRIKADTAMGVVFAGMFGLGIVLHTKISPEIHLDHILFGNIFGVGPTELWTAGIISAAVVAIVTVKWRDILTHAFDPVQARMVGMQGGVIHYGLLAMLSAAIVAMLSSVGIILAIGMLIAPGAIGFVLSRRFVPMMGWAVSAAIISAVGGVYLSFWLDTDAAPTIILLLSLFFVLALVGKRLFGWRHKADG